MLESLRFGQNVRSILIGQLTDSLPSVLVLFDEVNHGRMTRSERLGCFALKRLSRDVGSLQRTTSNNEENKGAFTDSDSSHLLLRHQKPILRKIVMKREN